MVQISGPMSDQQCIAVTNRQIPAKSGTILIFWKQVTGEFMLRSRSATASACVPPFVCIEHNLEVQMQRLSFCSEMTWTNLRFNIAALWMY
jgi:hypothetical protein